VLILVLFAFTPRTKAQEIYAFVGPQLLISGEETGAKFKFELKYVKNFNPTLGVGISTRKTYEHPKYWGPFVLVKAKN